MPNQRSRLLLVLSQPTQSNQALHYLQNDSRYDTTIAVLSQHEESLWQSEEFINKPAFAESPGISGARHLANRSPWPTLQYWWGLWNPSLLGLVWSHQCSILFGHKYISYWAAMLVSHLRGRGLILTTDATSMGYPAPSHFKAWVKRVVFRFLYNHVADHVLVPSTASWRFLVSLGIKESKVSITPYVVDNELVRSRAQDALAPSFRKQWNIPAQSTVILFCAKFIERKNPIELIEAFARLQSKSSYLIMAGSGPLEGDVQRHIQIHGLTDRVILAGLIPYQNLPSLYKESDILVHPALHEPWGLIVNEAMVCGCVSVVSSAVGAGIDLITHGETGFIYPSGDIEALIRILDSLTDNPQERRRIASNAFVRISEWSPQKNAEQTLAAVSRVLAPRSKRVAR